VSDGTAVGPDSEPVDLDSVEPLTRCRGIPADGKAPLRLDRSRLRDSVGLAPTSPLDEHSSVGAGVFPTLGNLAEAAVRSVRCAGRLPIEDGRRPGRGRRGGRSSRTLRPDGQAAWTTGPTIHPNGRCVWSARYRRLVPPRFVTVSVQSVKKIPHPRNFSPIALVCCTERKDDAGSPGLQFFRRDDSGSLGRHKRCATVTTAERSRRSASQHGVLR
jgi:hypothetical protein